MFQNTIDNCKPTGSQHQDWDLSFAGDQNLITNGDFAADLEGWQHEPATYTFVKNGTAWLAWGSVHREMSAMSQQFPVQGGTTYVLKYKLKGGGGIPNNWQVAINDKILEEYTDVYPAMDWHQRTFAFTTPPATSNAVLTFNYRQVC